MRKITINTVLAFVVLPITFIFPDFGYIMRGQYILYDARYNNVEIYLSKLLHETGYPLPSLFILIGILFPLEIVKRFLLSKKKNYFFLKSTCSLFLIILFWLLMWLGPKVLLVLPLLTNIGLSIVINGVLYVLSDRTKAFSGPTSNP
ncbi:hypothetical protein [Sphingobacterium paludis]|nr:hypothetical protein [Sphingobacterium paludis]